MTEIRVKIPLEGISTGESEMSVHAVSTLYDLWQDHVHYRTQAELTRQNGTELEFAREIRSSILAFFSYFDGVLNLWINKIDPNVPLHQTGFTSKLRLIREHIDDRTKCRFLDLDRREMSGIHCHIQRLVNLNSMFPSTLSPATFSMTRRKWKNGSKMLLAH